MAEHHSDQHHSHEQHSHGHSHSHGHHHHAPTLTNLNRAFIIGIGLNSAFVIIEIIAGFTTNSLALLTDAGHNIADVAALALSLIAFKLTKVKADKQFTYGYSKTTILVTLVNAVVLLVGIGGVGYEAILRLLKPEPTQGITMAIVAGIGIFINSASALLFMRDKDHDMNVKGAYLHMASDAVVSLGVVIAGIAIYFTHLYWIDSVVSLVIMVVILYGTWSLLTDSLRLSLDAVPRDIDMDKLKAGLAKMKGITGIHHIHVWALSTTTNALTAHIVIDENLSAVEEQQLKEKIKHQLEHQNIQHATLETERGNLACKQEEC
jgi:cobalt-zinc-cadmium efflux system protein